MMALVLSTFWLRSSLSALLSITEVFRPPSLFPKGRTASFFRTCFLPIGILSATLQQSIAWPRTQPFSVFGSGSTPPEAFRRLYRFFVSISVRTFSGPPRSMVPQFTFRRFLYIAIFNCCRLSMNPPLPISWPALSLAFGPLSMSPYPQMLTVTSGTIDLPQFSQQLPG